MVVRRKKKIRKKRGKIRARAGEIRRGAGNRGGRGKAGVGKKGTWHKRLLFIYVTGKKGFSRNFDKIRREVKEINLDYIESSLEKLLEEGYAIKKEDYYMIYLNKLGFNKLLGRGKITRKYYIVVENYTKKAKEKIESLGGKILSPREVE